MRLLTAVIQAALVGATIYVFMRLVYVEREERRRRHDQLKHRQAMSAWKP